MLSERATLGHLKGDGSALWRCPLEACPLEVPFGGALWSPVCSALLTSLLFMPAQVLAPLQANNARSEALHGRPSADRAPTPPTVQPPLAPDAAPLPLLPMRAPAQPASMDMDWEPEPDPDPEHEPEPEPAPAPPTLRPPCARLAARHPPPAAPTGPPMPLDSEDPAMLQQLQVFYMYFANSTFLTPYNQLQRRLGRAGQNKHFSLKPAFDDPSNKELLAKLQQLGSTKLTGDHNTISHHSMQLAVAMQQHYSNPGKVEAQLFIKLTCGYALNADSPELQASNLYKAHVKDLKEEAAKQRRLLALEEGDSLQDTVPLPCRMRHAVHVCRCLEQWQQPPTPPMPGKPKHGGRRVGPRVLTCPPPFTLTPLARVGVHFIKVDSRVLHGVCQQLGLTRETEDVFTAEPARSNHWDRWFSTKQLANQGFEFERTVETDGVSVCVHYTRPLPTPPAPPSAAGPSSSNSSPVAAPGATAVAAHSLGLPRIGKGLAEQREFVFNPATQIGVGIDPGVTQAVSVTSRSRRVWDPVTGQLLADQLRRWKLTKGQVKHGSGLNNARRDTERWLAPIKPHLLQLAAASSAGTSLEANLKHITVTLATWDAVWEVYLDPKWAQQRLRLYGAQDRTLEQFFKKRIGESRWRPLELCWWPDQGALPAKGKEYPGLGYKRVRDKPPRDKAQPAAAQ
ncbi:hypothetical protein QJQ45_005703 [Haematococcus lacustris]|nr:hypothetical protein QJQ45_005703 [Haematococcus lacustris]